MSKLEFTDAFSQFEAILFSFACHLTKDEDEAQDLLQETAYKAFKYRSMYRPHTNLRAWLMTIMRNTFINNYRQKKRRQTLNDKTNNNYFLNSGGRTVHNLGESVVTLNEVNRLIDSLEDWMKVPFLMHYQGFKYEEIATELDIPLGTVKSRIFFARKRLQESLQALYQAGSVTELLN
ncbi:MAG: RNA polymerase sigma factor [Phaeodactylibacter sp.]|nr:RNA polymerase sigma factor [Phaeodactylibacter sp.]MCB9266869.1 RNA polymerase sigma factor [Lewinellaceae bacterium]MCB9290106.1 RNA polymerase sigma factor [Lewinellaceae bacterium]